MQIRVRTVPPDPVNDPYPGPQGPGKRFIFSKNLVLVSIAGNPPSSQPAGTYSGVVTTLRAQATDPFVQPGSYLFQYEAIFKLNAVSSTPPLQNGQVIARGVVYLASNLTPIETRTFAITGGTGAYTTARGQVTEQQPPSSAPAGTEDWLLDIQ